MTDSAPLIRELEMAVANVAAGADLITVIGEAPFAGTVTAVAYLAKADLTGADTNTRSVTLTNKGQDGNGTTSVATLTFVSGVNANDFDEKAITLSGTPANLVVAEGDVLSWASVHAASGLADVGGLVKVEITRA